MQKIRPMKAADFDEILNLWKNTEGIGLSRNDDSKESLKKFLEKNKNTCFVAGIKNEIVGTVMGGSDGRRGHIYHLMVKPEHRKNGIGRKLLEKTEKAFKLEGIGKVFLVAFKKNRRGNKFWDANGYETRKDLNYRDKRI
jgi:ribosomal protein S18 acetylase RimI-like enzyme